MSELTLTVLRLGFLVLLWVMVLSVVGVLRRDLYGTRVSARPTHRPRASPAPAAEGGGQSARRDAPRSLVVTEGALKGTTIALSSGAVLLGRAPECTLVLDDDYASSRHARITFADGRYLVEDLGSTNGTFLGRDRVSSPVPLEPNQPLRIGTTVLELRR